MSHLNSISIYLFSYNRGVYLENMLRSLEKCADGISITVVDDASTDSVTLNVLESFKDRIKVLVPRRDWNPKSSRRLGGLYDNMRYALKDAREKRVRYALFVQDDMQMVRSITEADFWSAEAFFQDNPHSAQLHTCFMKKQNQTKDEKQMYIDPSGQAYFRPLDYQGCSGLADVGLFHVERFYSLFGDFRNNEHENNVFAKQHGIQTGFSVMPFMMYLPYPISYRHKGRSIRLRLVEWANGGGFFPYQIMEENEIDKLLTRDTSIKPYAEDWLTCPSLAKVPVWSFGGNTFNLNARGGARKLLANFFWRIRKICLIVKSFGSSQSTAS